MDPIRLYQAASGIGGLDAKVQRRAIPQEGAGEVADSMGQLFTQALDKLDQGQKATDASINGLVAGEPIDLHHVMLQMEESMVNLNLALQVRNKVIEAYQEVQRMQI
jgi:flagellar hook-basal body complex protein FliE